MPSTVPAAEGVVVDQATLRFIDVAKGEGPEAKPGQRYTVHYTGWLRDGTKFDSSVDRKQPFQFVQGRRNVIPGWEAGFEGMRVGGKRRLFIPYQMAYGELGRGAIPPKAELVFDVELLGVDDVPEPPPAAELISVLGDIEGKALQIAKAFPAEKYNWRPDPAARSFAEALKHLANGNRLLLTIATTLPSPEALKKQVDDNAKAEKEPWTKDQLVDEVTKSFAEVRKALETAQARALTREVKFFKTTTTQRGVFVFLETHASEHVGQLIAYARANGIAPPWSASEK
jgi:uncharacterized damage-inducible protein DinB